MSSAALASLRRQWRAVALVGGVAILWMGSFQPRWLIGSMTLWAYCLWLLHRDLELNHRAGERAALDTLGLPTLVTLARGVLLAVTAGFLFLPVATGTLAFVPAASYSLASMLDHVDGRLARALGLATRLGEKLDMELDAAGILVAALVAIQFAKVPPWYLVVGLARYAFVLATLWRVRRGKVVVELDPSPARRLFAGAQMGFLSVALWPPIPAAWTLFVAPLFAGATLAMFARDWWWVSGRLCHRP